MRFAFLLAVTALTACQGKTKELCAPPLHETTAPVSVARPTDILFVVDNSRSMEEEQEELGRSFSRFIDAIAGSGSYRIAVVTTDQSYDFDDPGEMGGLSRIIHDPRYPHGIIDIDDTRCAPVRPRIEHGCFRGRANERIVDSETSGRAAQIERFGRNVRVGTCGAGAEQAFASMSSALAQLDGCNRGFRRDDANLVIIFVSDEDDRSPGPVEQYVDDLEARFDITRVRIATVVGTLDGAPSYCVNGRTDECGHYCAEVELPGSHRPCRFDGTLECPFEEECQPRGPGAEPRCVVPEGRPANSCATCSFYATDTCCSAEPGTRYLAFAKEVERRAALLDHDVAASGCRGDLPGRPACITETICQSDFGESLARIARDLVATTVYDLSPPAPDRRRIRVVVQGAAGERVLEIDEEYVLAEDGSTVSLVGTGRPDMGDTVRITYNSTLDVTGTECLPP